MKVKHLLTNFLPNFELHESAIFSKKKCLVTTAQVQASMCLLHILTCCHAKLLVVVARAPLRYHKNAAARSSYVLQHGISQHFFLACRVRRACCEYSYYRQDSCITARTSYHGGRKRRQMEAGKSTNHGHPLQHYQSSPEFNSLPSSSHPASVLLGLPLSSLSLSLSLSVCLSPTPTPAPPSLSPVTSPAAEFCEVVEPTSDGEERREEEEERRGEQSRAEQRREEEERGLSVAIQASCAQKKEGKEGMRTQTNLGFSPGAKNGPASPAAYQLKTDAFLSSGQS